MARLSAILSALWRAFQRGEKSIANLAGNNFFLVAVLFLGKAGSFLFLIIGLVVLFPLSTIRCARYRLRGSLCGRSKSASSCCCGPSARGSIP